LAVPPAFIKNPKKNTVMAKKKLSQLELAMKKVAILAMSKFATKAELASATGASQASAATCAEIISELT